jgi:flavocytochrome c
MLPRPLARLVLTLLIAISAIGIGMLCNRLLFSRSVLFSPPFNKSFWTSSSTMSAQPVIVVGSGLAGLSAAHEALKAGASVRMFERGAKTGGNSIKASSGINGANSRYQKAKGIEKDELFYGDTVRSAGKLFKETSHKGLDREALVQKLTKESASAVEWLADEFGVDLSKVAPLGGHSVARTHRGAGKSPPGFAIVSTLTKKLEENPKFELSTSSEVTALDVTDGKVTGVTVKKENTEETVKGSVVFAAGGFAGDAKGLLAKYRPDLEGFPSTNDARPAAHPVLSAVGAEAIDMESVQIHPTGFVDLKEPYAPNKFLAAEVLRGEGGILLSSSGERFINELEKRDVVSNGIMKLPSDSTEEGKLWKVTLLLDPGACEATAMHIGFYIFKGLVEKKKVKDLSPEIIKAVDKYSEAVASGAADEFGRPSYGHWRLKAGEENREEEVCVGVITPVVHFTMGGFAINTDAQVLKKGADGEALTAIPGLWAAGEITGGIHGDNRLGGSSLLECVVYGREAGRQAAKAASTA